MLRLRMGLRLRLSGRDEDLKGVYPGLQKRVVAGEIFVLLFQVRNVLGGFGQDGSLVQLVSWCQPLEILLDLIPS